VIGTIIKSTGSWYTVLADDGQFIECRIKGKFRMEGIKATNPLAVGDKVDFDMDHDNASGIITAIHKRKNYIIRKSVNLSKQTHIIAANIDRAYLLVTLAQPRTSLGFVDRFLITAEAYHIPASIVFNKVDIYTEEGLEELKRLTELYSKLGYTCYTLSALKESDVTFLRNKMANSVNLVSGHSGVGKSTLINSIEPSLSLKTAALSEAHNKGIHTTTFAEMYPLKAGGFIIDTPGIKELGLVAIEKKELAHYFPEMDAIRHLCKFSTCVHLTEPKCAVIEAVENGTIAESRYITYVTIMTGDELGKKYQD